MEQIKKYWKIVIAFIILLAVFYTCENNKSNILKGKTIALEEQLKKVNREIKIQEKNRQELKDSILKNTIKNNRQIDSLKNKNIELQYKITYLSNKNQENKKLVENKNIKELVSFYNKRYNTSENYPLDSTKMVTGKNTAKLVNKELLDLDFCKEESTIQKEQLSLRDSIIDKKTKIINDSFIIITESEKTIELQKQQQETSDEVIKNVKKQLKKEKVKTWILVPLVFLGGILIK